MFFSILTVFRASKACEVKTDEKPYVIFQSWCDEFYLERSREKEHLLWKDYVLYKIFKKDFAISIVSDVFFDSHSFSSKQSLRSENWWETLCNFSKWMRRILSRAKSREGAFALKRLRTLQNLWKRFWI